MKKILIVSHCVLNTASKVKYHHQLNAPTKEELARRSFLRMCLDYNCQLIQLPCPEFLLYGSKRWGHTKTQFDHPMFKSYSREQLKNILSQIEEYESDPEAQILGIVGINGSPSCGVDFTYTGNWGGELSSCPDIPGLLANGGRVPEKGIFMEELEKMMAEKEMHYPFYSLTEECLAQLEQLIKE